MGDMPNFEDMSEEEQMRWLESLAKRQGADETGFTTSADMEVEEIDPETAVIDEPGYTPYYQSSSSSSARKDEEPAAQETPQPQAETPQEPDTIDAMAVAGAPADDDMSSVVGDDPMAWLESLAKRQGAHEGFTTAADMEIAEIDPDSVQIDEPGYTPYYQSSASSAARQEEEMPAEEVPEAPIQDPYPTPMPETPPPPIQEIPEDVPVPEAPVAEEPAIPEPPVEEVAATAGMPGEGDLPADIDPMVWLESLAKRQGAHEGFTTSADMEVEEIDPDSVQLDEPGYTPYYSTATTGGSRQEEQPPQVEEPEPEMAMAQDDEEAADGWLQSLADDQDADVDDFLTELAETTMEEFEDDFAFAVSDDLEDMGVIDLDEEVSDISGMSDEEIAAAQAAGTITPQQELAWLQSKISQAPDEDSFDLALSDEELGEPVEGDIPDWLKQQMPSGDQLEALEEFSSASSDLDMSVDLDDSLVAELAGEGELNIDLTEPVVEDFTFEPEEPISETINLLEGYSPDVDEWAAALDEDVTIEDIESLPEPDWYSVAIQQADAEAPSFDTDSVPALSFETEPISPESFLMEEDEGEIPGWLQGVEPTIEEDPDLPDWLKVAPAGDEAADVSDWLSAQQAGVEDVAPPPPTPQPVAVEQAMPVAAGLPAEERLPLAQSSTMPSWYVWEEPVQPAPVAPPPVPTPAPPPVQQQPRPEPVAQRPPTPPPPPTPTREPAVAPVPVGYEDYKQRLEDNPQDHDTRINLARNLSKSGNLDESLAHYETLINNSAQLDLVATDLGSMIKNLPRHPKARRMLGDVYMRQGRLQEALDTYRGALDQI